MAARSDTADIRPGGDGRVAVEFPYQRDIVDAVRAIRGRRWHPEDRCWTVPASRDAVARLLSAFPDSDVRLHPSLYRLAGETDRRTLGANSAELVDAAGEELKLRGYARRTRRTYLGHLRRFLQAHASRTDLPEREDLRRHLVAVLERGLSRSYVNQRVSAVKFLYTRVLGRPGPVTELPRPRQRKHLPKVLSRREVTALLRAVENPKHRALLMLIYSAGLKVGEVVRLRPEDVDPDRRTLHVQQGKGTKDRYVMLSRVALDAKVEARGMDDGSPESKQGGVDDPRKGIGGGTTP